MPSLPGANPLVAERASWRSSQSRVSGDQQPIGNPYRFLSFCAHLATPCATPIVTRGEGSFSYQGVSTRGGWALARDCDVAIWASKFRPRPRPTVLTGDGIDPEVMLEITLPEDIRPALPLLSQISKEKGT